METDKFYTDCLHFRWAGMTKKLLQKMLLPNFANIIENKLRISQQYKSGDDCRIFILTQKAPFSQIRE